MTLPSAQGDAGPEDEAPRSATIRRVPKYGVFIGLGAVLGLVVTTAGTLAFEPDPAVGMLATVGYTALWGVTVGGVLGALAALLADAIGRRRARPVEVERGEVHEGDEADG